MKDCLYFLFALSSILGGVYLWSNYPAGFCFYVTITAGVVSTPVMIFHLKGYL